MGTERGGCSRLMKTPRHNGGAVHSRSMRAKKKDNHCRSIKSRVFGTFIVLVIDNNKSTKT